MMKQNQRCVWAALLLGLAVICSPVFVGAEGTDSTTVGEEVPLWVLSDPEDFLADLVPRKSVVPVSSWLVPGEEAEPAAADLSRKYVLTGSPQILIYHTHTTEAYRQTDKDTYQESGAWRTKDNSQNIVAVGEELKKQLEAFGFTVIHDTTDHEPPKLATSYTRSEETMEKYKKKYPDLQVFIDLHRDAANAEKNRDDVVVVDGQRCARVMCVVGKGTKYEAKPNFQENYLLAGAFTSHMEEIHQGFTRPVRVKDGRYNQHISDTSLLIEVGHNANTFREALNTQKHIATALHKIFLLPDKA